jgi:hypothetical protein
MQTAIGPRPDLTARMLTRSTLQWLVVLLLAACAVCGFGAYYVWKNSDALLRAGIESKLAEIVPEWDVAFRHVHFDGEGGVRLVDVAVAAPGDGPIVEIPELHVALDRELFAKYRKVQIQKVVVLNPVATLIRDKKGEWNFQRLKPLKPSEAALPEIQVLNGDVLVCQEASELLPASQIGCHHVDARLYPSANRQYRIQGKTDVDHTGVLALSGGIDLRSGAWELTGNAPKVDVRNGIVDVAMDVSPDIRRRLETIVQPARQFKGQELVKTASVVEPGQSYEMHSEGLCPDLGLEAQLDVHFRIAKEDRDAPLKYLVRVGIEQGRILELLPIPLFDLHGAVQIDENGVQVESLSAANGISRVFVDGGLKHGAGGGAKEFTIQATNLHVDQRIREHLPAHLQRLYDSIRPEGRFNVDIEVSQTPGKPMKLNLRQFTVLKGSVEHEAFRYPVREINGTIKQQDGAFVLDLFGMAGDRPGTLKGTVRNLGPEMEVDLRIETTGVPLDERFVGAFQLEKQAPVRKALEALRVSAGVGDSVVRFVRNPETGLKFKMQLDADIREAAMSFKQFPLAVTGISGKIHYDALKEDVWHFESFAGEHRGTPVRASGSYSVLAPGALEVKLDATGLPIDQDLRDAVAVANAELDPLFDHLQPFGLVDLKDATVRWAPGGKVQLDLPSIALNQGRLKLSGFPFQWEKVAATGRWEHALKRLSIQTLLAWHGETSLQIDGETQGAEAFVLVDPREDIVWRAHFDRLFVGRLLNDIDLLRALPGSMQSIVQGSAITGAVDVQASLDLKQFRDEAKTVTAQWRSKMTLPGNDLSAGVPLKGVKGEVVCVRGIWDGMQAKLDGYFELQRARVYGLPLENITGPYSLDGDLVTVGNPNAARVERPENPHAGNSVEAAFYGGKFGVDSQVRIGATPDKTLYGAVITVRNAALDRWAYDNGQRDKLRGPINGVINLKGQGPSAMNLTGSGWVQMTNAQLYDLPVLLQVFTKFDFRNTDTTAFHYVYSDFNIHHGIVEFSDIELVGETLGLKGRGYVGFAGDRSRIVDLDFKSRMKNSIPIIGPLVSAGGRGLMRVRVAGTIDTPQAFVMPTPILDDAFTGFMRAFDAGNYRPRQAPPPVNPFPLQQ